MRSVDEDEATLGADEARELVDRLDHRRHRANVRKHCNLDRSMFASVKNALNSGNYIIGTILMKHVSVRTEKGWKNEHLADQRILELGLDDIDASIISQPIERVNHHRIRRAYSQNFVSWMKFQRPKDGIHSRRRVFDKNNVREFCIYEMCERRTRGVD